MIELIYSCGGIFVYSVNDWWELRKNHRIVGETIGNTNFVPCLPVKLQPEEVLLLLQKSIVKVSEIGKSQPESSTENEKLQHETFKNSLLDHEKLEYRKIRKVQLELMLEQIVARRRDAGDDRSSEEILEIELEKSSVVTKDNMIWPILLEPLTKPKFTNAVSFLDVLKHTTNLKFKVYEDLWEKGYFITQGQKFGGDFLVYVGDPVVYHAIFIVRCVEPEKTLSASEIVAFGRLCNSVKKKAVLASVTDDIVSYITIDWIDA